MNPYGRFFLALVPSLSLVLGHNFLPAFMERTPAAFFYPSVFFGTWIGGIAPGVLSVALYKVYVVLFVRPHMLTSPFSDPEGLTRMVMFTASSLIFIVMLDFLRKALKRANNAIAVRDDFLSLISHELKTPLTALKLNIDIIKRVHQEEFPDSPSKVQIESSVRQVGRLERLIVAMMDLTMFDSGQLALLRKDSDLKKIIQDAVTSLNHESIQITFPEVELRGHWDPVRLEQIASNIIHNAIKYGHGKPVEINMGLEENKVWFSVKDYGAGIDEKDHKRIFKRFQRANTCTDVQGLGLGLYLTKKLVKFHQGEIEVESKPGVGSLFKVRLPVK